jgi:membrane fusion protein, heavy metal efflux system
MRFRCVSAMLAVLLCISSACSRRAAPEADSAAPTSGPVPAAAAALAHATSPAPLRATAPSDLDRPVAELFADSCEHRIPTYACPECRYENGVAAAGESLFSGGLLRTARVEERRLGVPLLLTGEVQFDARHVTHVSTQTEGILRAVHVALGDRVQRGEPLVEVDLVELGEAQAAALESRALLELARRNFDRLASLRQEGIVAEKDYFAARQECEASQIRADAAAGKLIRLGMAPEEAQALRAENATGRLVVRAPAAGTVLEMHAVLGEVARADAPLLTIGDYAAVWVWADLYERDVAQVAQAQSAGPLPVRVTVSAYPDTSFAGRVDFVSPALETASRTVKLRIAVANPRGQLLAGMFARVEVLLPEAGTALAVPEAAVLEDEGRAFVFVHHHERYYVRRPVRLGRTADGWVEVSGPLAAGQIVVADGAFLLKSDVLRSKMGAGCAD